jgi:hypothetical protein
MSESAKDFFSKILKKKPSERLGYNGPEEVKQHPWFNDIDWEKLYRKEVKPPYKPKLDSPDDLKHFEDVGKATLMLRISLLRTLRIHLAK